MLIFKKIKEKKINIIAIMLSFLVLGTIFSFKISNKEYVSIATLLLIKTENSENNIVEKVGNLELSDELISTFNEILKSDENLNNSKIDNNANNKELKKSVELKRLNNSDTFQIKVKNINSDIAINQNKKLVENFSNKIEKLYSNIEINVIDNPHIEKYSYNITFIIPIIISLLIGGMIGIIYALCLVIIEKNKKLYSKIESELNLKKLADIPLKKYNKKDENKSELIAYENEKTKLSKSFKNLMSNIQFVNVNNKKKNIILISSPYNSEGKSFVTANLGISFAEAGKKVVLIDSDMENGRQNLIFNLPNNLGFSNYLSRLDSNGIEIQKLTNNYIRETSIKNLSVITSGTVPPNSTELLTSKNLDQLIKDLSVFYDVVIIDGTSGLKNVDALILARKATSTIIVSDYRKTKIENLVKCKKDFQNVGGRIIGIIVNKVKIKKTKSEKIKELNEITNKIKVDFKNALKKLKELIKKQELKLLTESKNNQEIVNDIIPEVFENKKEENIDELNETSKFSIIKKDFVNKINNNKIFSNVNKEKDNKIVEDNKISEEINKVSENYNKSENYTNKKDKNNEISQDNINNIDNISNSNIQDNNEFENNEILYNQNENLEASSKKLKENLEIVQEKLDNIKTKIIDFVNVEKEKIIKNAEKIKNKITDIKNKKESVENIEDKKDKKDKKDGKDENATVNNTDINDVDENIIKDDKKIKNEKNKKNKKAQKESKNNENLVLVIVDAENGCCRIFSQYCFVEKNIKGIDKTDGFEKDQYSFKLVTARKEGIMNFYGLNKKQVQRIDPLVYITLCNYDDTVWLEKKMISNKAEKYVFVMSEEYEKNENETELEYEIRTKNLRKEKLEDADINIEYKLNNIWKTMQISFIDRIMLYYFSNMYNLKDELRSESEKQKTFTNLNFYEEIIAKAENRLKKLNLEVSQNEEIMYDNISDDNHQNDFIKNEIKNNAVSKIEENHKASEEKRKQDEEKKAEEEAQRLEEKRKLEQEKEKIREEKKQKRKERREILAQKKMEKIKEQEELKRQKEEEKERQKEEARIEEELLGDNLYPKTKNNRNI